MTSTILANSELSTVMNLLLIRFGIIAAGVAILAIVLFTVALTLKRKGKLGAAVKKIAPMARSYADSRNNRYRSNNLYSGRNLGYRSRGGAWKNTAANAVARYLDDAANREDR